MADIWFYTRGGKQMDPVSTQELRRLAAQGMLKPNDLVWQEGMPQWIRAASARGLFDDYAANGAGQAEPARRSAPRQPSSAEPISSPSGRFQTKKGLGAGAKALIVLGVALLLGGLGIAAVLIKLNASNEDPSPPTKPPVVSELEILKYSAVVAGLGENNRDIDLNPGKHYEISAVHETGGGVTLYLDDSTGRDVARDVGRIGTAKVVYSPPAAGRFKIQVINDGDREATIRVSVKEVPVDIAKGDGWPRTVEKYTIRIADLKEDRKIVRLQSGIEYEINVSCDGKNNFDIYLDDAGGKELAGATRCVGTGKVIHTPDRDDDYRVVTINSGPGDAEFRVEVVGRGPGGALPLPKGPDVVVAYRAFLRELGDHKRQVDLKAGIRYEITIVSARGCNMSAYLDDETGKEVTRAENVDKAAKLMHVPTLGGRFSLEMVNNGKGDSDFTVVVRDRGPADVPPIVVKADHAIPGVVESYRVFLKELKDDKRFVELKGGIRYEITAKSDRGCKMDLFLDDEGLREVATRIGAPGTAKITYTPPANGKFRLELINQGAGDSDFTVELRSFGKDGAPILGARGDHLKPGLLDSYKVFLADLKDDKRPVDLQAGIRYEVIARNDKGCRMDLYLDDALGKEVARDLNSPGPAKIVYVPTVTGRYRIELVNNGIGNADFTVELHSMGRDGGPVVGKDDHAKPGIVASYRAMIADLKEDRRMIDLRAGIRYEISARSDKGCRMDMFLDDEAGRELAKSVAAVGTGKILFSPPASGKYRLEVVNLGAGDSNFDMEVRSLGPDKAAKGDPGKLGLVESYRVFIKDLKEDRRQIDLKAGVRYDIAVKSDKGCRLDLYLDDDSGRELAKHVDAPGVAKLSYTPTASGKHRIEVVNMGVGDSNFDVEVHASATGPAVGLGVVVDSYKAFVKDLGENKRMVTMDAGVRYEITASSAKGCRMDLYIDDEKGKEVARTLNVAGKSTLIFTPTASGRYQVVVVNTGVGDSDFSVDVRAFGGKGDAKGDKKLPAARLIVPTREGARAEDMLAAADPFCPFRGGCHSKVYEAKLAAGKTYQIDLVAGYDTYLFLTDADGKLLLSDDDGSGTLNARIVFTPPAAGTYRILCTSYGMGATGNFTLTVREN